MMFLQGPLCSILNADIATQVQQEMAKMIGIKMAAIMSDELVFRNKSQLKKASLRAWSRLSFPRRRVIGCFLDFLAPSWFWSALKKQSQRSQMLPAKDNLQSLRC
jgi:hypothetical protein